MNCSLCCLDSSAFSFHSKLDTYCDRQQDNIDGTPKAPPRSERTSSAGNELWKRHVRTSSATDSAA
jgi:hypothetical protein